MRVGDNGKGSESVMQKEKERLRDIARQRDSEIELEKYKDEEIER